MGEEQTNSSGPGRVGKMIMPDLSALSQSQLEAVSVVNDVTREAQRGLQSAIQSQRKFLNGAFKDAELGEVADFKASEQMADQFAAVTTDLTESTTKMVQALQTSMEQSLAKIEQTVIKYSGG